MWKLRKRVLGVELASDRWVQRYGVQGLPVVQAYPGLPAAEAGISGARRNARGDVVLGDIITHIDGKPIASQDDFYSALEARKAGDVVTVKTRLGDKTPTYRITLIESQ